MAKYETLNVNPKSKISIDRLANKFEMSKVDLVEKMVFYFEKTGLNPQDVKVLTVAEELNKFRDTIISFMRKQEKDFILPTFGKMDTLIVRMKEYIDNEAPRRGDIGTQTKSKSLLLNEYSEEKKDFINTQGSETTEDTINEKNDLKNKIQKLELIQSTTLKYFDNVLSKTEEKSTGLRKMPVIELPMADIREYKEYTKKLSHVYKDTFR
jgi:hypothetical protein